MDDGYIVVTINGQNYYCQADRVNDLQYIDGKLVNVSNSSITLVSSFGTTYTFPYIQASSMRQAVLYTGSSYNGVPVNAEISYNKNSLSLLSSRDLSLVSMLLLVSILGVKLLWKH